MINLRLSWPPTINTYYTIARGRKILSKRGREFKAQGLVELMEQKAPKGLTDRLDVRLDLYPPDKRSRDIDNIVKPVLDVLQDYGVFENDEQIDYLAIRRLEQGGYIRVHIFTAAR